MRGRLKRDITPVNCSSAVYLRGQGRGSHTSRLGTAPLCVTITLAVKDTINKVCIHKPIVYNKNNADRKTQTSYFIFYIMKHLVFRILYICALFDQYLFYLI